MKKALFSLIAIILFANAASQDLVLTARGDSLNCRITKIGRDVIHYTFRRDYSIIDTVVPSAEIRFYQHAYYPRSVIPASYNTRIDNFKRFQFGLEGGLGFAMAKMAEGVPEEMLDYVQGLRSGFNFGASMYNYIDESVGVGIKYFTFMTSNSISGINYTDPYGVPGFGSLSDKIQISFYGPALTLRSLSSNGLSSFYTNYFAGYVTWRDICQMNDKYIIRGSTFGLGVEGGYDIEILNNILIGFEGRLFTGVIKKVSLDNGYSVTPVKLEEGEYEGLLRVDFSVGIKFR